MDKVENTGFKFGKAVGNAGETDRFKHQHIWSRSMASASAPPPHLEQEIVEHPFHPSLYHGPLLKMELLFVPTMIKMDGVSERILGGCAGTSARNLSFIVHYFTLHGMCGDGVPPTYFTRWRPCGATPTNDYETNVDEVNAIPNLRRAMPQKWDSSHTNMHLSEWPKGWMTGKSAVEYYGDIAELWCRFEPHFSSAFGVLKGTTVDWQTLYEVLGFPVGVVLHNQDLRESYLVSCFCWLQWNVKENVG